MIGQTVGKYRILDRIGRGGMGTVYRGLDETLDREVAVKVLNPELNDPEVARRFRAEAVTVARLNHPAIATIYELFQRDDQWLMIMEFVRGETLEHLVERAGALAPERAAELCQQTLIGLAHAHRLGVVHRDLKPANLMLTESNSVKIMDFGIARVAGSEHLTSAGYMMGTPAYMAPEQVLGHEVDARTDLYALGVVLFRLATGKLPFKGDTPFAMAQAQIKDPPTPVRLAREGSPAWVDVVVARALAKEPSDRFQTADEFREALQRAVSGLPIEVAATMAIPAELVATMPPRQTTLATGSDVAAAPTTGSNVVPPPSAPVQAPTVPPPTGSAAVLTSTGSIASTAPVPMVPSGATGAIANTAPIAATSSTAMPPVAPMTQPPATQPVAAPATVSSGPGTVTLKKSNVTAMAAAAALVVVALGAFAIYRWRASSAPPAATTPAPAPAPTEAASPITPPTPPADAAPPQPGPTPQPPTSAGPTPIPAASAGPVPVPPPAGSAGPMPVPARKGNVPDPNAPARGSTAGPTTPVASTQPAAPAPIPAPSTPLPATTGTRGPAIEDTHISFVDVKMLTVIGKKAQEQDVVLTLGNGQITVTPKKGGTALMTLPYRRVARGLYTHAKEPQWDVSLNAPPSDLDIPGSGVFRSSTRHWLTLQSNTEYAILRLSDDTWNRILQTIESRTGLKIDHVEPPNK
jgi:serine/threonine-protein kinase